MRERPYINVSDAAINSNKASGFFDLNVPQYTSHYKYNRALSVLPIQAHFDSNKYRTKKPIPSNNIYISIEGFLEEVETDSSGHVTTFHVSVDNINFLGRASLSPTTTGKTGNTFPSISVSLFEHILTASSSPARSSRFKFNFDVSTPNSSMDSSVPDLPSATPHMEIGVLTRRGKRKK